MAKGLKESTIGKFPETVGIDLTTKEINDYSLGDEVQIVITGTVKELDAGDPGDADWEGYAPRMQVLVDKQTCKPMSNAYTKMAEDDS